MTYEVIWTPDAERDLAEAWLLASNQREVSLASHRLDQQLRRFPLTIGESRSSYSSRIVYDPPLGASFEVIEDDRKVFVQAVWLIR